jgi:outer membrane receptor for ferrienterochelin and colicins
MCARPREPAPERASGTQALTAAFALALTIALALVAPRSLAAQAQGAVVVRVTSSGRPLSGAAVAAASAHATTDASGRAQLQVPAGRQTVRVTAIGFAPETLRVTVGATPVTVDVELHAEGQLLSEVRIAATRNERRVSDEPTRVEVVDREDVEEQIGGSPGVIAELLTESGGVRVQRTSAGSSGASVRIRGLRGRYTKILSDGLPLFGITTEGLGTLQIPPIDLQRVEVIKGVASALYGPTALGGVVNLVSERPTSQPELVLNQTTRGGSDAVLWQTRALDPQWGYTLLAGGHRQSREDGDADGWADLNGFTRFVVRPRLFWTGPHGNSWFITSGLTSEDRAGGTVGGARLPNGEMFRQDARTRRGDLGTVGRLFLRPDALLTLRASTTQESGTNWFGVVRERESRNALFSEAAVTLSRGSQVMVAGAALERDDYTAVDLPQHDYTFTTPGLFVEHTWSPVSWFGMSSSARADFHSEYGTFLSPRVSALFRAGEQWNARVSAGSGVYTPTPFSEETGAIGLTHVRPIATLAAERAVGASVDVAGKVGVVELYASAHRTKIDHPVGMRSVPNTALDVELVNAARPTQSGGVELYARTRTEPIHVKASYTYIQATELDLERGGRRQVPLNPRHAGGLTAVYERAHDANIGLELYYNGRQSVADDPFRTVTRPYITIDALVQKQFGRLIVFVHGEDLNNVRQTDYDPIVRPTPGPGGRWTTDVWAPLEGSVVNAGFRWQY